MKLLFFISLINMLFANTISGYTPIQKCVNFNSKSYIAIRSFKLDSQKALLIVDANSLKSGVVFNSNVTAEKCPQRIYQSRYIKLLTHAKYEHKHKLQNDGIISSGGGVVITTDLCPSSKKGFEDRLYLELIKRFKNPVPITLFITKRWILKHKKAFRQLRRWQKEGKLDITWGNHTAKHIYHPKVKLEHNFVLSPQEHLTQDVLNLEIALLKRGVVPSIFFRFPGLVSDKKTMDIVTNLGLIAIGSNTWIAKGEKIKQNSIILVHGNKNEPKGVDMLLKDLKRLNFPQPISIKKIHPTIERNANKKINAIPIDIAK